LTNTRLLWYNIDKMKAVFSAILIIILVLMAYSALNQFGGEGRLSASLFNITPTLTDWNTGQVKTVGGGTTTGSAVDINYATVDNSSNNASGSYIEPPAQTVSKYIGKVQISRISKATISRESLITLSVKPNKGEPINLTGFTIKTRRGEIKIPKGSEYYRSNYPAQNINIVESLTVYLIGGKNPLILNNNFRTNSCMGYLSRIGQVYPGIRNSCSAPKLDEVRHLTPYCQDYLIKRNGCQMPEYSNDLKIRVDSSCVNYIVNYYTYNGCFDRNSQEDNFLGSAWYIYLNSNYIEELHDIVEIYDQNGLLVDEYKY